MQNGNIKEGWKFLKFGEIFGENINTGIWKSSEYMGKGYKLVKMNQLFGFDFINSEYNGYELIELTKNEIAKKTVNNGDLLFSRTSVKASGVGKHSIVINDKELLTYDSNTIRVRLNSDLSEPLYYYYYFCSQVGNHSIISIASGASVAVLKSSEIGNIIVPFPPLLIQKKIASILSNYDELIENNNRRIQILEKTAQEIYKEWFVNFRFPGHETIKMIDSETDFGEIPEGWNIGNLGDRIKILKGKNITKSTITPGDIPVVAGGISPAYYHNTPNVEGPVITISASGANAGYIRLYHQDIWASDCSYISKDNSKFIYYYFLLLKDKQINITNLQVGSAQPHVYPKDIISFKVIAPSDDLIAIFEDKITPIFHELSNLENQNNNIKETRDLLLPKLISGEIDVSELEVI